MKAQMAGRTVPQRIGLDRPAWLTAARIELPTRATTMGFMDSSTRRQRHALTLEMTLKRGGAIASEAPPWRRN